MDKETILQETAEGRVASKRKKKSNKKIMIKILAVVLCAGLWCAIVYYGYTYAKEYVDTSIRNIQQENALNIQQLTDKVGQLSQEIKGLRESLDDTDSSLSYSTRVQKRIDDKLEELDDQLEELERSLEILKEAP